MSNAFSTLPALWRSLSRSEWRFLIIITVILLAINVSIPLLGLIFVPPGYSYTGILALNAPDVNFYFAQIFQAKAGAWTFHNSYTTEALPNFVNTIWLAIGLMAKIFRLAPALAFHLGRVLLVAPMVVASYLFFCLFIQRPRWRQLALGLFFFSSGLGLWACAFHDFPKFQWPIDLWVPEASPFLALYNSPNHALAWLLLIIIFGLIVFGCQTKKARYFLLAAIGSNCLLSFQPFHLPTVLIIPTIIFLVVFFRQKNYRLKDLWLIALYLIFSLPVAGWRILALLTDPSQMSKTINTPNLSPMFFSTAIGYGFIFATAMAGAMYVFIRRRKNSLFLCLAIWLVIHLALLYAPYSYQRRLNAGLYLPMILLTVILLQAVYPAIKKFLLRAKNQPGFYLVLLAVLLPLLEINILSILSYDVQNFFQPETFRYLPIEYKQAVKRVGQISQPQDIILTTEMEANSLPAYINRQVYLGHGIETLNYEQKSNKVKAVLQPPLTATSYDWLRKERISYLLLSKENFSSWLDYRPSELKLVYENQRYLLFQVK